jgi:hypothetical protein
MPLQTIDFSKTIIYKIVCKDANINDIYIGHTTDFTRRKYDHKSHCNNEKNKSYNLPLYKFIRENSNWSNWDMIQIEQYPCNDVNEARARERYWIEELKPSLNCDIPNRSKKEYQEDNKEVLAEKKKKYREQNKDIISKKKKEYCENNKEKIVEKSKNYYQEHKEDIIKRVKQYSNENKEKIAERSKQYRDNNKEVIAEKKKEYLEKNKETIYEKATERIRCEICNCDVPRRHISTHNKSKKHLSLL